MQSKEAISIGLPKVIFERDAQVVMGPLQDPEWHLKDLIEEVKLCLGDDPFLWSFSKIHWKFNFVVHNLTQWVAKYHCFGIILIATIPFFVLEKSINGG